MRNSAYYYYYYHLILSNFTDNSLVRKQCSTAIRRNGIVGLEFCSREALGFSMILLLAPKQNVEVINIHVKIRKNTQTCAPNNTPKLSTYMEPKSSSVPSKMEPKSSAVPSKMEPKSSSVPSKSPFGERSGYKPRKRTPKTDPRGPKSLQTPCKTLPKPFPNPPKIDYKTEAKKTVFFEACFFRSSSILASKTTNFSTICFTF